MRYKPELLEELLAAIADAGTKDAKVEFLNLPKYVRPRMNKVLKKESEEIQTIYSTSQHESYREELKPIIRGLLEKYDFNLRFGEIVTHIEDQNLVG